MDYSNNEGANYNFYSQNNNHLYAGKPRPKPKPAPTGKPRPKPKTGYAASNEPEYYEAEESIVETVAEVAVEMITDALFD